MTRLIGGVGDDRNEAVRRIRCGVLTVATTLPFSAGAVLGQSISGTLTDATKRSPLGNPQIQTTLYAFR